MLQNYKDIWAIVVSYLPRPFAWHEHFLGWDCYQKQLIVFDCEKLAHHVCETQNCEMYCEWVQRIASCCICNELGSMYACFRDVKNYSCEYEFDESRCVCETCYHQISEHVPSWHERSSLAVRRKARRKWNPRQRRRLRKMRHVVALVQQNHLVTCEETSIHSACMCTEEKRNCQSRS